MSEDTQSIPTEPTASTSILKPKLRAFLIHFLISLVIFVVLLSLMVYFWFPKYLFNSDGGWEGLRLLIGVDLVLGPLLTLIAFKPNKPGLKLDLTLIGIVQISCLAIGIGIIYSQRPLAVIFTSDRFITVNHTTFELAGTDPKGLKPFANTRPIVIYIPFPEDPDERLKAKMRQTQEGPYYTKPDHYAPYDAHANKVPSEGGVTASSIMTSYPELKDSIEQWMQNNNYTADSTTWVPFYGRYKSTYLVLDSETGHILGQIPDRINPKNI